jgi:hypothetical protein
VVKTTEYAGEEAEQLANEIMEIDTFDVFGRDILLDMHNMLMSRCPLHERRARVEALIRDPESTPVQATAAE